MPKSDHSFDFSSNHPQLENLRKLISALSHDLRTPLTVLKGDIEVSLLHERRPEEYQKVLRSNLEEIDRMSLLLEDLIILVRAEIGDLRIALQEIEITDLIAGLFAEQQDAAEKKGIKFQIESTDQILIKADPNLVRKLFSIILENAIQYSTGGGEIRVVLEKNEQEARISVQDQGIGIAAEDMAQIFEPFFRGEKARVLAEKGSGLGLAICKKIIFAHNGGIEVESGTGANKGAVFKIRLPIRLGQGQGAL